MCVFIMACACAQVYPMEAQADEAVAQEFKEEEQAAPDAGVSAASCESGEHATKDKDITMVNASLPWMMGGQLLAELPLPATALLSVQAAAEDFRS